MSPDLTLATICAALWALACAAPWQFWRTRERLDATVSDSAADLADITVLIPARNESALLPATLEAVLAQGRNLRVVVIDDGSTDDTGAIVEVRARDCSRLTLIRGASLPDGWTGKLWALEQGVRASDRPLLLFLDADIVLRPGFVAALLDRLRHGELALASVMARLHMQSGWERLLIPPFVYFFRLLYPFALSNRRDGPVAAAAGGCILVRRAALEAAGGLASLRDAIIDDCSLARRIKDAGGSTWIGLTRDALSMRRCAGLSDVWAMVTRTAFCQLRYSTLLLLVCTVALLLMFVVPVAGLALPSGAVRVVCAATLALMMVSYIPLLRYYRLPIVLSATLPVAAALYLAMTWHSAVRYWRGTRSVWKGREYGT